MAASPKKSALGAKLSRGKDALFGTSTDLPRVIEVELAKLRPNPEQPRGSFDEEALQGLADSIAQHGLLQPIAVARDPENEGGYLVVAGERRFRAFERLGRETMPAVMTSGRLDEVALIENVQREDLSPLEEAEALLKMTARHGYTQSELGKIIGKKQNTVSELLKLTSLPQVIKDELAAGDRVSRSVLIELSRIRGADEQLRAWREVKGGGLTVRAARREKAGASQQGERASRGAPSPERDLIASGRRFVDTLRGAESADARVDEATYGELLELYREIGERLDRLSERASTGTTKTPAD